MPEQEPKVNVDNVCFIDEYPELAKKVQARRMGQLLLFRPNQDQLILFPVQGEGDEGA